LPPDRVWRSPWSVLAITTARFDAFPLGQGVTLTWYVATIVGNGSERNTGLKFTTLAASFPAETAATSLSNDVASTRRGREEKSTAHAVIGRSGDAGMAQADTGEALPATPVSSGNEGWSDDIVAAQKRDQILRKPLWRKELPVLQSPELRLHDAPVSPVSISPPRPGLREAETASIKGMPTEEWRHTPDSSFLTSPLSLPLQSMRLVESQSEYSRASSVSGPPPRIEEFGPELARSSSEEEEEAGEGLRYHAFDDGRAGKMAAARRASQMTLQSHDSGSSGGAERRATQLLAPHAAGGPARPISAYSLGAELRGRSLSPLSAAAASDPGAAGREPSASRRSPGVRPVSYVNLLHDVPYKQQVAPGPASLNNASLQSVVGVAASLLDTKKTLDMYRANVKKTNDPAVQYEFAVFMVNAARDARPAEDGVDPAELIAEAKHILQRLADRAYPFAQYYLGDGFASGLFAGPKAKPDPDRAFTLFLAASKHGHAEASYRVALCYEFGWGTAKSYPKAVQFYRTAAAKNHPGAATRLGLACLRGDMGLGKKAYGEGVKWLKRASESADHQYNAAPYELGLLHLTGYGDDIFKDEAYAAQLFTQAADLGHAQANFLLGQAYENGLYGCPRDAALSVHYYNGAATRGHPEGMMALCAWYMVGAEPVLERDEAEAYAWAKQAAEAGLPKAEYAVGYFTEMGIGCRRDPLEANVWYVRAADRGNETAKQRLEIIRAAAAGTPMEGGGMPMGKAEARVRELAGGKENKKKFMGLF